MNGFNWQIELQCPQCGAPVTLEETYTLLLCPYCRTKMYLQPGDYFRYYIPAPGSMTDIPLYIPYWRFRGLCFSARGIELTSRFADINLRSVVMDGMPESLGVRPQAMKLKFVSPSTTGHFIPPRMTLDDIMRRIAELNADSGSYHVFIGEIASLIYTPVYLKEGVLTDAILNRPLAGMSSWIQQVINDTKSRPDWQVKFIPTLCPNCSWDLEGEKEALVLLCRNCDSAWRPAGTQLERIPFAVMECPDETAVYLPFWRMKAQIEGIRLESFADMVRLANLPKAITRALEEKELYFWSPAFKINPAAFQRWSRQMTIYQPEDKMLENLSRRTCNPVTLPVSEAAEGIALTIADVITDKRRFFPTLPHLKTNLIDSLLVYHPFVRNRNELVHARMKIAIDKNALAFGSGM